MIKNVAKNKYKIIVECGIINGKRKRLTRTIIGTKQEAKILEAELLKNINNKATRNSEKILENKKLTFQDLANMFIEKYCSTRLKENTIYGYKNLLKVIFVEIGNIFIEDITSYTLECYYNKLKSVYNYSSNTIIHHYVLINNIFERGLKWRILQDNPNRFIDKPNLEKKEVKIYEYMDLSNLVKALNNEPIKYKAPILLCIDTGMRREELNGLKWENINFDTNEIIINQIRIAVGNKVITSSPKTVKSKRTIVASQVSMNCLKELKEYQSEMANLLKNQWENTGYVFVNDFGKPYYPDTLSKIFKKIIKKYNLPNSSLHKLRHVSASLLVNNKEDIAAVSARLGHANISTTLNMYTHALELTKINTANTMDRILSHI